MAQFNAVGSHKKPNKSLNDGVKHNSNRDQNINKSQIHNQAKERIEQGSIQQVESEAQNLGNDGTINGTEDLGEGLKTNKKDI
jgi:hypothetical protein